MKSMKTRITKTVSAVMLTLFTVALAMSIGIYSFAISPYIHDWFNTSSTEVVSADPDENEDTEYYKMDYSSSDELMEAKIDHIRETVGEGTVLLKNTDNALPISTTTNGEKTKVTLLGQGSEDLVYGMDAGAGQVPNADTFCKHFDTALTDAGFDVNQTMVTYYENTGINQNNPAGYYGLSGDLIIGEADPCDFGTLQKDSIEEYNDVGIIVLRRNVGEGFDLWSGESDQPIYQSGTDTTGWSDTMIEGQSSLELVEYELELIKYAIDVEFDTLILVLNSNQQIALGDVQDLDGIDAIIQVGGLGYNGVDGVVDVLIGEANPSGKLVNLWSRNSLSSPAAQNMGSIAYSNIDEIEDYFAANEDGYEKGESNPFRAIWYVAQMESIYVGYRYYETRYEDVVLGQGNAESTVGAYNSDGNWSYEEEVMYTFGYGLSYTTFTQEFVGDPVWDNDAKTYTFTVKVTNTGEVAGKDVVQIYASTPYTETDIARGVEKSSIQLVNFEKTQEILPGNSVEVEVVCDLYNIASWDSLANNGDGGYILSEGEHYFALGNGAHEALNNVLAAKAADGVSVDTSKMDAAGNASLVWSFDQGSRDEETYSVSKYTGEDITNQFEDADVNYWLSDSEQVTYLTRDDWSGTFPIILEGETNGRTSVKLEATDDMLLELIGQTSVNGKDYSYGSLNYEASQEMVNGVDTDYQVSMMMGASYDDDAWALIIDQLSYDDMANLVATGNGFTYACDSITYPGSRVSDGPIGWYSTTIALPYSGDNRYNGFEGDIYSRCYEGTLVTASTFNKDLEYERGVLLGNEALYFERTGIWGISAANLARTAFSGRNGEYLGEEPMIAGYMGAAVSEGYSSKGGVAYTKHFAFNDQETNRYGMSTFMTEQEARELSLRCFEGILSNEEGRTKSMGAMESFSRIGLTWAGQSYPLLTQVLRNEWGFEGCVITDMAVALLTYYHAPEAVKAGTDYFDTTSFDLYGEYFSEENLKADPVLYAAVRQASQRILYTFVNSNAMNGISKNAELIHVTVWWEKAIIAINVTLGVLAVIPTALYGYFTIKDRRNETDEQLS